MISQSSSAASQQRDAARTTSIADDERASQKQLNKLTCPLELAATGTRRPPNFRPKSSAGSRSEWASDGEVHLEIVKGAAAVAVVVAVALTSSC